MVDLAQTIEEWKDLCSVKVDDQVLSLVIQFMDPISKQYLDVDPGLKTKLFLSLQIQDIVENVSFALYLVFRRHLFLLAIRANIWKTHRWHFGM